MEDLTRKPRTGMSDAELEVRSWQVWRKEAKTTTELASLCDQLIARVAELRPKKRSWLDTIAEQLARWAE